MREIAPCLDVCRPLLSIDPALPGGTEWLLDLASLQRSTRDLRMHGEALHVLRVAAVVTLGLCLGAVEHHYTGHIVGHLRCTVLPSGTEHRTSPVGSLARLALLSFPLYPYTQSRAGAEPGASAAAPSS
jgi:hypothetical protein